MNTEIPPDQGSNSNPENGKPLPGRLMLEYDKQPFKDIADAIKNENNSQQIEKSDNQRIAAWQNNEQARANRISSQANRISIRYNFISLWMMIATIIAAGFTIGIFFYNTQAVNAARRANALTEQNIRSSDSTNREFIERATESANAAKRSADASLVADSISKIALDSNNSYNKRNFQIQQRALQIQYDNIAEAQKQFSLSNRPFIQITGMKVDSVEIGQLPQISYFIMNSGKFPATILSISTDIRIAMREKNLEELISDSKNWRTDQIYNITLGPSTAFNQTAKLNEINTDQVSTNIKKGTYYFVFKIIIKFKDFIQGNIYDRSELFKIRTSPIFSSDEVYLDETEIHKK